MKMKDAFYLNQKEPYRGCLLALRSTILKQDDAISETVKYGMPCFLYREHILCYLWIDKKTREPYILFTKGKYMDHPELESGIRKKMKIFRVDAHGDLPLSLIGQLLQEAMTLSGTQ